MPGSSDCGIWIAECGAAGGFGAGRVGRVNVDFLSGLKPTGTFEEPSAALVAAKELFGSSRRARWFGR